MTRPKPNFKTSATQPEYKKHKAVAGNRAQTNLQIPQQVVLQALLDCVWRECNAVCFFFL